MPRFVDNDDAYMDWMSSHADGYALNIERTLNPSGSFIHRSDCTHLVDERLAPGQRTGSWIKVCSTNKGDLEAWSRVETGTEPSLCSHCNP